MITVAICNQKGGVGKSTTTFHLARAATLAGLRVLVVDADPQGNISAALARDELPELADALAMVRDEVVVAGAGREARLAVELATAEDSFELTLIDCPPSLDHLTVNALAAADSVLVVSQSKQWSASGLAHLTQTIVVRHVR